MAEEGGTESQERSSGRFRFKSEKHKRHRSSRSPERKHRHSHRSHRISRSKRQKTSHSGPKDDPSTFDDSYDHNSRSSQYLDPAAAFRESLFDALADDEGAAYWQGVYGQPIHTYPRETTGPEGELERMTDEEYATYVRSKMYEKTHQHIIEERAKREEERQRRKQARAQGDRLEREKQEFEAKIEASLRRGEERKKKKRWTEVWTRYLNQWENLKGAESDAIEHGKDLKDIIPWPVESGKRRHVTKEEVEDFLRHAPDENVNDFQALLKIERVRWHPDKIQHRFGGGNVDQETMKAVTAVFQVVDKMWTDLKEKRQS